MNAIQLKREIRAAIQQGDLDQVKTLIGSSKKRLEMMTAYGTWLHLAASVGNIEIAKHLIALGADINRRGTFIENLPINSAALMGHTKMVRYLLSCGAKVDLSDPERNPLFSAIEGGYVNVAKVLIDHGIDTRVKYTNASMKDMDALAFARERGQRKIATLLAKIGKYKISVSDYAAFKRLLKKAVALHFTKLSKTLSGHRCNGYCLYTSDDVSNIGPVANRTSKARGKPRKHPRDDCRYSADEWSDWNDFGLFSEVNDWIRPHSEAEEYSGAIAPKLLNLCVDVLAELKDESLFDDALPDLFLIVWVSDSSNSVMQKSAARLNNPKIYKAYAAEFADDIEEYIRLTDEWGISMNEGGAKTSNRLHDKILKTFQCIVQAGQEEELFERVHDVSDVTRYCIAGHMKERDRSKALLIFKRLCRSKIPFISLSSEYVIKEMEEQERKKPRSLIYRHKNRKREFEFAIGDPESIKKINAHVERYVGPVASVLHEMVSDLVHIDVHIVEPSAARPCYTLVTSGMSDIAMRSPEDCPDLKYSELVICLPPNWKMNRDSWEAEENYWPIRILKYLARFPHEYQTWLWAMHTVPNGNPPGPFASNTAMNGVIILPPLTMVNEFHQHKINKRKTIHFHAVIPLYSDEMDLKLKKGPDALLDGFDKHRISEILDPSRASVVQRKSKARQGLA